MRRLGRTLFLHILARPGRPAAVEGATCGPRAFRGRERTETQWTRPAPLGRRGCASSDSRFPSGPPRGFAAVRRGGLALPVQVCVFEFGVPARGREGVRSLQPDGLKQTEATAEAGSSWPAPRHKRRRPVFRTPPLASGAMTSWQRFLDRPLRRKPGRTRLQSKSHRG